MTNAPGLPKWATFLRKIYQLAEEVIRKWFHFLLIFKWDQFIGSIPRTLVKYVEGRSANIDFSAQFFEYKLSVARIRVSQEAL
jgi:hypothetical protein